MPANPAPVDAVNARGPSSNDPSTYQVTSLWFTSSGSSITHRISSWMSSLLGLTLTIPRPVSCRKARAFAFIWSMNFCPSGVWLGHPPTGIVLLHFLRCATVPEAWWHNWHWSVSVHPLLVPNSRACVHCPPVEAEVSQALHALFHCGTDLTEPFLPNSSLPIVHGRSCQSGGNQSLLSYPRGGRRLSSGMVQVV